MAVPGSNLLSRAFKLISRQEITYYSFLSRSANAIGLLNATYDDPVTLYGSVQPVARRLYEQYGLDLQKNYFTIFVEQNTIDVRRDVSGDYAIFDGMKLQCESITAWYSLDGWVQILSVQVQS